MVAHDDTPPLDDLLQEFTSRLRQGEPVTASTYAARYPGLANEILEVFPVVAAMQHGHSSQPDTAPTNATPEFVGPFRVVRALGHGGMGRVFEVELEDGTRAALKLIHAHLAERPGFVERFQRELKLGLRVDHPAVVQTLESGMADNEGSQLPYILLEYVEGESLRHVIETTGSVSERLARELAITLAGALAAVHDAGIVHRDIKPENVVIAPDERIKLLDLGVAYARDESLRLTHTGQFVGSLLYAAPEQMAAAEIDGRADLYSLGLMLFELLTGRMPQSVALDRRMGATRAPHVRDVTPAVSPFLDAVIHTLLARRPEDRFASAHELGEVLERGERGPWWKARMADLASALRPQIARPAASGARKVREAAFAASPRGSFSLRVSALSYVRWGPVKGMYGSGAGHRSQSSKKLRPRVTTNRRRPEPHFLGPAVRSAAYISSITSRQTSFANCVASTVTPWRAK